MLIAEMFFQKYKIHFDKYIHQELVLSAECGDMDFFSDSSYYAQLRKDGDRYFLYYSIGKDALFNEDTAQDSVLVSAHELEPDDSLRILKAVTSEPVKEYFVQEENLVLDMGAGLDIKMRLASKMRYLKLVYAQKTPRFIKWYDGHIYKDYLFLNTVFEIIETYITTPSACDVEI